MNGISRIAAVRSRERKLQDTKKASVSANKNAGRLMIAGRPIDSSVRNSDDAEQGRITAATEHANEKPRRADRNGIRITPRTLVDRSAAKSGNLDEIQTARRNEAPFSACAIRPNEAISSCGMSAKSPMTEPNERPARNGIESSGGKAKCRKSPAELRKKGILKAVK